MRAAQKSQNNPETSRSNFSEYIPKKQKISTSLEASMGPPSQVQKIKEYNNIAQQINDVNDRIKHLKVHEKNQRQFALRSFDTVISASAQKIQRIQEMNHILEQWRRVNLHFIQRLQALSRF